MEAISSYERLAALAEPWRKLAEASSSRDFFLLPQWSLAWWETFGADKELSCLAVWDGEELIALAPLYRSRKFFWRTLSFIGHPRHSDRVDVLLAPGREAECCRILMDELAQKRDWDALLLREFAPFSETDRLLAEAARERGMRAHAEVDSNCLYVPLTKYGDYANYFQTINTRDARSKIRRKFKKFLAEGKVAFATVKSPDAALVREMAALDAGRSIRALEDRCFFDNEANIAFIERVTADPALAEHVVVHTATDEGRLIAYALVFEFDNRAGCYQINFDIGYQVCSPGTLLFFYAIEQAYLAGRSEFDFLKGDESYKSHFTDASRDNKRLFVYSGTPGSRLLNFYHRDLKPLRRKLGASDWVKKMIPAKVRARLDV